MTAPVDVTGPPSTPSRPAPRLHLSALALAMAMLVLVVMAIAAIATRIERRIGAGFALVMEGQRTRGLAMQRAALADSSVVLLFGASELAREVPLRAQEFFATAPTGFRAFPVGERGTPLLMNVQDMVALGEALRGRRVAVFLSIEGFLHAATAGPLDSATVAAFRGTFSPLHATATFFSSTLPREVKADVARRLLRAAPLFDGSPLLATVARQLADSGLAGRVSYALLYPFGRVMLGALELQDHVTVLDHLTRRGVRVPAPESQARAIDWAALESEGERLARGAASNNPFGYESGFYTRQVLPKRDLHRNSRPDSAFLAELPNSELWPELDLVIAVLRHYGATPLFVCSPFKGVYADFKGTSPAARQVVYSAVQAYAQRRRVRLATFEQYDADPYFLVDQSHPSPKGWSHYNKALDAFAHGRLD